MGTNDFSRARAKKVIEETMLRYARRARSHLSRCMAVGSQNARETSILPLRGGASVLRFGGLRLKSEVASSVSNESAGLDASLSSSVSEESVKAISEADDWAMSNSGGGGSSNSNGVQLTSHHTRLIDTLTRIPAKVDEIQRYAAEDMETYGMESRASQKQSGLFYRQLKIEEEQMQDAVNEYTASLKQLMEMGKGTNMKYIQRMLLQWYEPLTVAIQDEIKAVQLRKPGKDRSVYGPYLLLLDVEKISTITMNAVLNAVLQTGNQGAKLVQVALSVANLLEMEVNINKLKNGNRKLANWESELIKLAYDPAKKSMNRSIAKRIRKLLDDEEPWSNKTKVKVGAFLIQKLVRSAKYNGKEAFKYSNGYVPYTKRRLGVVRLDDDVFKVVAEREKASVLPRFLPMIVPPKKWTRRNLLKDKGGCYFRIQAPIIRTHNRSQLDAARRGDMTGVLEGLNYLGAVPWVINQPVLEVFRTAMEEGIQVGELPPTEDVPEPSEASCYRLPSTIVMERRRAREGKKGQTVGQAEAAAQAQVQLAADSDDQDNVASHQEPKLSAQEIVEELERIQYRTDNLFDAEGKEQPVFDERLYQEMGRRVRMKNAELHSLRCDLQLKYWVAEKFAEDRIYFPCNMDFRGRAYPIPPNLSHLGSDLCRGLLSFAEAKPLGEEGLFWLKVHLANLFGHNKVPFEERAEWAEAHAEQILESVHSPLAGHMWWSTAENPFQALAVCHEIVAALESGDPESFESSLPIHQDGSCNGLQHYAALGRDEEGGMAVNLAPAEEPQDVYSRVLEVVSRKLANDKQIPAAIGAPYEDPVTGETLTVDEPARLKGEYARLVADITDRKVIKQTVMTSVYGVTRTGARAQVQARLTERILSDPSMVMDPEIEKSVFAASMYLANLTLASLEEMFSGAKEIMDWLGACARLVAAHGHAMSWVSPMGLPIMQPYRQSATQTIHTTLQSITLSVADDALPVSVRKQKSAFPPNYVHSLDATHMLMTALRMKNDGLTFASVHDSYWTHAADIPIMSAHIRDCFIELYDHPVLEDLRDSLQMRYPDIEFPPVPERGRLNLDLVRSSKYFFH
jgi:DNA-directed RNA polymerase